MHPAGEEKVKCAAVKAMGAVVAKLADHNMEAARIIVRRLMWNLNDESGGIGWGSPEAMGEILARHRGLAGEYAHILISYIREDGNYLENQVLQEGVFKYREGRRDLSPSQAMPYLVFLRCQDSSECNP
jgi:hypothetical protein